MLANPSTGRRNTGRLIVLAGIATALPLTATRAIEYVEVSKPAAPARPVAAAAPVAAAVPAVPVAAVAAVAALHPVETLDFNQEGTITINGKSRKWRELTPEEKRQIRREIAQAKEELARTHIDKAEIDREVRAALAEARIDKEELRHDLAEARDEIERAMSEVDAQVVEIRRSGQNPEQIKATIRASLRAVEAIDVEAIHRQALASVDHKAIRASVAAAEASVARAQAAIDQMESQLEEEE